MLSCRRDGFQLSAPTDPAALAVFDEVCRKHEVSADLMLKVPQSGDGEQVYDREDRVRKCARLLKDLVAGLGPQRSNTGTADAQAATPSGAG
ncbi:MAG: hypothetical protein AB1437_17085 [Pseudomonadota bacterium]